MKLAKKVCKSYAYLQALNIILSKVLHRKLLLFDLNSNFAIFLSFGDLMLIVTVELECISLGTIHDFRDKVSPNSMISKSIVVSMRFLVVSTFPVGYLSHRFPRCPPFPHQCQWVHAKKMFLKLYWFLQLELSVELW